MSGKEKILAFPVYPGVTPLDLVGPLTVLRNTARTPYRTVVVGRRAEQLTTDTPLRLAPAATFADVPDPWTVIVPGGGAGALAATEDATLVGYIRSAAAGPTDVGVPVAPDRTFAEVPHPAIVLVPGGALPTIRAMSDPAVRNYARTAAASAELVTSVCTGSLILDAVGLLQGRDATTNWFYSGVLENLGATYQQRRWVDDGRVIMSAGVSAGIDMALHLVARLTDEATARRMQLAIDYDPKPPYGGIDYAQIPPLPRAMRGAIGLLAPAIAARPKRLTRAGR